MNGTYWVKHSVLAMVVAVALAAPAQAATPDAWITTKTKLVLLTTEGVSGTAIHVDTILGKVTLHGKVRTAEEKVKAESIARKIDGVLEVRNLLQIVTQQGEKAVQVADDALKPRVEKALQADSSLKESSISVKSVNKGVVLLDTAGLPGNDPALRMQLETLASRGVNAKNYLVMAATSQGQVLKAAYHSYKRCGLSGCILTKADEATSLGEVLGLAISQRLPVAYLTDGPRIPDDLHVPRSHQLVSRAVGLQASQDPSEDTMAEMFAGLYQQPTRRAS